MTVSDCNNSALSKMDSGLSHFNISLLGKRDKVCVCVCVRARARVRACVRVCVRERERESSKELLNLVCHHC